MRHVHSEFIDKVPVWNVLHDQISSWQKCFVWVYSEVLILSNISDNQSSYHDKGTTMYTRVCIKYICSYRSVEVHLRHLATEWNRKHDTLSLVNCRYQSFSSIRILNFGYWILSSDCFTAHRLFANIPCGLDCEYSLIWAMVIEGRAKYTHASAQNFEETRRDARGEERQKLLTIPSRCIWGCLYKKQTIIALDFVVHAAHSPRFDFVGYNCQISLCRQGRSKSVIEPYLKGYIPYSSRLSI